MSQHYKNTRTVMTKSRQHLMMKIQLEDWTCGAYPQERTQSSEPVWKASPHTSHVTTPATEMHTYSLQDARSKMFRVTQFTSAKHWKQRMSQQSKRSRHFHCVKTTDHFLVMKMDELQLWATINCFRNNSEHKSVPKDTCHLSPFIENPKDSHFDLYGSRLKL